MQSYEVCDSCLGLRIDGIRKGKQGYTKTIKMKKG